MEKTTIDGQQIELLNDNEIITLFKDNKLNIEEQFLKALRWYKPLFLNRTIKLGFGRLVKSKQYIPYTFYPKDNAFNRVQLLTQHCSNCSEISYLATPFDSLIYIGISDEYNRVYLMRKATSLLSEYCPNCKLKTFKNYINLGLVSKS